MSIYTIMNQIQSTTGFDRAEAVEVLRGCEDSHGDYEQSSWRFIDSDEIDRIQREELEADTYILGCFNASFIAGILNTSEESIKLIQNAEGFEGLGEMMLPHINEVQEQYSSADGYGHHFAHYDHNEHEVGSWLAFRVN